MSSRAPGRPRHTVSEPRAQPVIYKCAQCAGIFESDWTDEEALAETERNFGPLETAGPLAVICNDCYQQSDPVIAARDAQEDEDDNALGRQGGCSDL